MEPEKKPDGDGGTPPAPVETPKYITEEQLDKTLSPRLRSLEQKLDKAVTSALETLGGKLKTELAALIAPPKPETKPDSKIERKEAPDPELKKLQDQIASLTHAADEARSERDTERANARDAKLRSQVGDLLAAAGIDGVRGRHAIGLLVDAEKRVRWSDEGDALVFRTADRDDVDLDSGLRAWLKTDDAKLYLPPKGTQGSGDRPGGASPPSTPAGPPDRRTVGEALRRALQGQL